MVSRKHGGGGWEEREEKEKERKVITRGRGKVAREKHTLHSHVPSDQLLPAR
jgi:hypothetical protein